MEIEYFIIGLALALIFTSVTGYFPGGIIVPGYLVLFVDQPLRLLGTLAAALLAFLLIRLASGFLILFGKRRFVVLILLGALFSLAINLLIPSFWPEAIEFKVIGLVIPGLIANNCDRQGLPVTISSLAIVVTALFFVGKLWSGFINLIS